MKVRVIDHVNHVRYKDIDVKNMKTIKLENPTPLTKLTNHQCKFPLWKNSNEPQLFCGRTHWDKSSYCKMHYVESHDKRKEKKDER